MRLRTIGALLLSVCAACNAGQPDAPNGEVDVTGPIVVGYFAPMTPEEMDDPNSGTGEGVAHVIFAVEDTLKCLKSSGIEARGQLEMATVLTVKEGRAVTRLVLPTTWPEAAGAYLFLPGKPPRQVPAQAGPSSLIVLVPEAAADYFSAKSCREE